MSGDENFTLTLTPGLLFSYQTLNNVNTAPTINMIFDDPTGTITLDNLQSNLSQLRSVTFPSLALNGSGMAETWTPTVTTYSLLNTTPDSSSTITIDTIPANLGITVDGVVFTAPQTFQWVQGDSHTLAISSPQSGASGVRYSFSSWSDTGTASHTITVPITQTTYIASFNTEYQLGITVLPEGEGTSSPASGNWYTAGSVVPITASSLSHPTWRPQWSGCNSITGNQCNIIMNAPQSISATLTAPLLKTGADYSNTIAGAYALVSNNGTVMAQAMEFTEVLNFNRLNLAFTLGGGYDSTFATVSGATTIHGSITITAGTATINNIVIR